MMRTIDPTNPGDVSVYRIIGGCIVPRPIAWLSTVDAGGTPNLAPFSFFMGVAATPPMLAVSILPKSGNSGEKDSLRNAETSGEMVVNVVSAAQMEAMNRTSAPFPAGVDEFGEAGLGTLPSSRVKPPRVAGAPIHMECKVDQVVRIRDGASHIIVAEVVLFHIDESVMDGDDIDLAKIKPVGRLNKNLYTIVDDLVPLDRPRRP